MMSLCKRELFVYVYFCVFKIWKSLECFFCCLVSVIKMFVVFKYDLFLFVFYDIDIK